MWRFPVIEYLQGTWRTGGTVRKNAQMNVKGHFSQPCIVALHVAMRNASQGDLAHPFHDGRQGRSNQECRILCCLSFGSILIFYLALWNFTALNQAKHLNGKNFRPISRSLSQSKPCCFRDGHMTQKTPIKFCVHFFEKCPSPCVLDQRVYKLLDATVLLPLKDRTSKGRAKS